MDEQTRSHLARRASPYGLAIVPETSQPTVPDPAAEWAIQQRWQHLCEQHGAAILGIRDVPASPVVVQLDGVRWELGPLGTTERAVHPPVFNRLRALEGAGVPFAYFLWGEELPPRSPGQLGPEPAARGSAGWGQPARRIYRWGPELEADRDPLLIGVIRTAPWRGVWLLLGKWFH